MEIIQFTEKDLDIAKNRARFIRQMPHDMELEALEIFRDMAQGGGGGDAWQGNGATVREYYSTYSDKSDAWFQEVLYEYKLLEMENGQ